MKSLKLFLTLALFGAAVSFSSCGDGGAAAAAEAARLDSLRKDSTMQADKAKAAADSAAAAVTAAAEKAKMDSIHMADSLAAAAKGGKKK